MSDLDKLTMLKSDGTVETIEAKGCKGDQHSWLNREQQRGMHWLVDMLQGLIQKQDVENAKPAIEALTVMAAWGHAMHNHYHDLEADLTDASRRIETLEWMIDGTIGTQLGRLYLVANRWQEHNCRTIDEVLDKIEEEVAELRAAQSRTDQLDELGDVIATSLRALHNVTPNELEFLVRVMEMKATRRTGPNAVKDKKAEAEQMADIAKELL